MEKMLICFTKNDEKISGVNILSDETRSVESVKNKNAEVLKFYKFSRNLSGSDLTLKIGLRSKCFAGCLRMYYYFFFFIKNHKTNYSLK